MNSAWRTRYELAIDAAQHAGKFALKYFDADVTVEWKSNQTPVTIADKQAEELLRTLILAKFPHDGFLGEETGETKGTSGFRWIIDPIDGTRSFVRGIPLWATLVGLEYQGEQIAGVTFIPPIQQLYRALKGDGAYRNDRRIRVSDIARLDEAQCFYSGINWFVKGGCREAFLSLVEQTQRQRGFGDFYGFMLVAQGSGEFMIEYGVNPWDIAALKPIVEEAGGVFTDWDNTPTIHRPDVLASNGKLHAEVLRLMRDKADAGFNPQIVQHAKDIT